MSQKTKHRYTQTKHGHAQKTQKHQQNTGIHGKHRYCNKTQIHTQTMSNTVTDNTDTNTGPQNTDIYAHADTHVHTTYIHSQHRQKDEQTKTHNKA